MAFDFFIYFPQKAGATTTLNYTALESYPQDRETDLGQSIQETPGGIIRVGDLGQDINYYEIKIINLSSADKVELETFLRDTANGAVNSFDIKDQENVDISDLCFVDGRLKFRQTSPGRFSTTLLLRQNIS